MATNKQRVRRSYRDAVDLIAQSDDVIGLDEEVVRGFVSVRLVAILFDYSVTRVARDVMKRYKKGETPERRRFFDQLKGGAQLERLRERSRVIAHAERLLGKRVPVDTTGRVVVKVSDVH